MLDGRKNSRNFELDAYMVILAYKFLLRERRRQIEDGKTGGRKLKKQLE